jgi:hypothetical protein
MLISATRIQYILEERVKERKERKTNKQTKEELRMNQ